MIDDISVLVQHIDITSLSQAHRTAQAVNGGIIHVDEKNTLYLSCVLIDNPPA